MAMLKHHEEADSAFLARVRQSMELLYQEFADQGSAVEYIQQYSGSDSKLSKYCRRCNNNNSILQVIALLLAAFNSMNSDVHSNSIINIDLACSNTICGPCCA